MRKKRALLVMPRERSAPFLEAIEASGMEGQLAADCREFRGILASQGRLDVVITDLSLRDGNWWTVHKQLLWANRPARLIVSLPRLTKNIAAVLAHAFGVLSPPYEATRIRRLLAAAVSRRPRPHPAASAG